MFGYLIFQDPWGWARGRDQYRRAEKGSVYKGHMEGNYYSIMSEREGKREGCLITL